MVILLFVFRSSEHYDSFVVMKIGKDKQLFVKMTLYQFSCVFFQRFSSWYKSRDGRTVRSDCEVRRDSKGSGSVNRDL